MTSWTEGQRSTSIVNSAPRKGALQPGWHCPWLFLVLLFAVLDAATPPSVSSAARGQEQHWIGVNSQEPIAISSDSNLKVILLGTAGGPTIDAQRLGISTLILAGPEKLLFDCGRGLTTGMARLAINPADVTKVFLTHLHSDHIVSLPELYLFPWASQGRASHCWCGGRMAHDRWSSAWRTHSRSIFTSGAMWTKGFPPRASRLLRAIFEKASSTTRMASKSRRFSSTTDLSSQRSVTASTIEGGLLSCPETRSPLTTWSNSRRALMC